MALWQAEHVAGLIRERFGIEAGLLVIKTKGDSVLDTPLAKIGGKGLFVKEIEDALLDGRADIAVHSLKDVPMELPEGLVLGAVLPREDPADMLFSVNYAGLTMLPSGAVVGTSSLRRQSQVLARRPDVKIEPLRGNVDTRLRKLQEGQFDAVIMAAAGMNRLGLRAPFMDRLSPERFVPAAGQGALGLEVCAARQELVEMIGRLDDRVTRLCVEAERGLLAGLDGSCQVPVAAHATLDAQGAISLDGLIARLDGSEIIRRKAVSPAGVDTAGARNMGLALAADILENGGRSVLNSVLYASA